MSLVGPTPQYGSSVEPLRWDTGVPIDAADDFFPTPAQMSAPQDVVSACEAANVAEFVGGFRFGYGTHCGGKGSQLSGGQRREYLPHGASISCCIELAIFRSPFSERIAIARAIHRHPQLVLCDEATAALDSESERKVQAALDAMLEVFGKKL